MSLRVRVIEPNKRDFFANNDVVSCYTWYIVKKKRRDEYQVPGTKYKCKEGVYARNFTPSYSLQYITL